MINSILLLSTSIVNITYFSYFIINNFINQEEKVRLSIINDLSETQKKYEKIYQLIHSISFLYLALICFFSFISFMTEENPKFLNIILPLFNAFLYKAFYEKEIINFIINNQIKKDLKISLNEVEKEREYIKESIKKENLRNIVNIKDLSFDVLKVGECILYEINNNNFNNQNIKAYGLILLLSDTLNSLRYDNSFLSVIINHSLKDSKYIPLISDTIYSHSNRTSTIEKNNLYIIENISLFGIKENEFLHDLEIEIRDKNVYKLKEILKHNKNEEVISVYNTVDKYLKGENDLEEEDLKEIIEIYIKDETTKNDFYKYISSKDKELKKVPIKSLKMYNFF